MENTKQNNSQFSIKGFTAIQIGIYFLLTGFIIKQMINGFVTDGNALGMLSVQLLEILILIVLLLFFVLSAFAIYFKNRRISKRNSENLWTSKNKLAALKYMFGFLIVFSILFVMSQKGMINQITSSFLIGFGAITHVLNETKNKFFLAISMLCVVLAMISYIIPSYWYASILLIGLSFIVKGVVKG